MSKFVLAYLLATVAVASAHEDEVFHHHCACEAEEFGFDIDCNNKAAMIDALTFLKASTCATDCTSAECETNWLIMQAHYDYCPEGVLEEIVEGVHDYEMTCKACEIYKPPVEGAPDCPTPVCTDSSGNDAYATLVEGGCFTDCTSDICRDNIFILRAVHDGCEEGVLSTDSEEGLHDLEVACAEQICNNPAEMDDPLICDQEHDHQEDEMEAAAAGASGAAAAKFSTTGLAALLVGAMMIL